MAETLRVVIRCAIATSSLVLAGLLIGEAIDRLGAWWRSWHRPATPAQSTPDDTQRVEWPTGLHRIAGHNWVERPYAGILHFQPAFHVPGMTPDAIASNLIQLCGGGPATVEAE